MLLLDGVVSFRDSLGDILGTVVRIKRLRRRRRDLEYRFVVLRIFYLREVFLYLIAMIVLNDNRRNICRFRYRIA